MWPTRARLSWAGTSLRILALSAAVLCSLPALAQPALYSYITIAGDEGVGSSDGTNRDIRFDNPTGIVSDPAGNLFVSDPGNSTIRKLTKIGTNWVSSTIAGRPGFRGSADGTNTDATFAWPSGLALDPNGNLLLADALTIRKLTPIGTNWVVTTIAGLPGQSGSTDGTNDAIRFYSASSVAVNSAGEIFVADYLRLRKLVQQGKDWVSSTIDVPFYFYNVSSVSFDSSDRLFVAGTYFIGNAGNFGLVDRLTKAGTSWNVETLPIPPNGNFGSFSVSVAPAGTQVFVRKDNNTIWQSTLTGTNWLWTQLAGQSGSNLFGISGSADGTNQDALFRGPADIALDRDGNLLVADCGNHAIRKITPSGTDWVTTTIAGHPPGGPSLDGANQDAHFSSPNGIVVDPNGSIFVADTGAHAIRQTDRIGTNWVTRTIAGTLGLPGSADGTNTLATFHSPAGLALGGPGVLYVADTGNHTIRRLQQSGSDWVTTTAFGLPGSPGSQDGTNSEIRLDAPYSLAAAAPAGDVLYIVEGLRLRKVTRIGTNWVSTTLPFLSGDYPDTLATSQNGQLFVTDASGAIYVLSSAPTNSVLDRIADYDTGNAIAVDSAGNLVAGNAGYYIIRKVARLGSNWVSYAIGGNFGYFGLADGTNSDARFQGPSAIAVDAAGNLFLADGNLLRLGLRVPVPAPAPVLTDLQILSGAPTFAWTTTAGLNYQIESSSALDPASWMSLGPPLLATNTLMSASDLSGPQVRRFYRVVLLP